MTAASLVSSQNNVQAPFIIVRIGKFTFGHCDKTHKNNLETAFNITYPNYIDSLNITKINGTINTFVLNLTYAITPQDDPNRLEKVFSSVSNTRTIHISYGDWNNPAFIYKDEEAIITKLTTRVNLKNSTIQYIVNCTSTALSLTAGSFSFEARLEKPSTVIKELLMNERYNLTNIFKGMRNLDFNQFIAGDDREVHLEAKPSIGILEYISYLVSCMAYRADPGKLKTSCYYWAVYDDVSNKYGGSYFKVVRVAANTDTTVAYNTYEVDIGYPTSANVIDFTINNDDSWSILYNYADKVQLPQYTYHIDDNGNTVAQSASPLTNSKVTFTTNEATRNWWSRMTQFPINATLVLKGLLRPAMLMSYVKVNTYFYGHKHTSSGLYIITKQEDSISSAGYKTTLSLTRVGGDPLYA